MTKDLISLLFIVFLYRIFSAHKYNIGFEEFFRNFTVDDKTVVQDVNILFFYKNYKNWIEHFVGCSKFSYFLCTRIRHVDRLINIDWLIDWLIDWMTGWSIDWLIDWLFDWLIDWLIDLFIYWWLVDRLIDWLIGYLIDWLIDLLMIGWSIDWLIDWSIDWLNHWFINLSSYLIHFN